jgi:hypothetical protein
MAVFDVGACRLDAGGVGFARCTDEDVGALDAVLLDQISTAVSASRRVSNCATMVRSMGFSCRLRSCYFNRTAALSSMSPWHRLPWQLSRAL